MEMQVRKIYSSLIVYFTFPQELMEYELPRNLGNRGYEKKLELSHNELESAVKEVMSSCSDGHRFCF